MLLPAVLAIGSQPPNLVFFLIDDYGNTDIGYHNQHFDNLLQTPNLDKLALDGIRLESYYVQPICTPTRSQLLSGRYQIHTGLQHGVIHPQMPSGLPVNIPLISNKLGDLGYRCHKVGKWHLGFYTEAHCPWRRGFVSDYGYLGGEEDYWTHVRTPGFDFRRDGIPDRGDATKDNGDASKYSTKLFRSRAIDIIEDHAANFSSAPLFLYVPFQAVHAPLQAPPFWLKKFNLSDFDGNEMRHTYAAMVMQMDFAVEKIVTSLKDNGLYNNTIIILSADNGGILPGGYNWPYRGQKATLWEGGMRAVGFVHSPLLPAEQRGHEYHGLVHISDWFPTMLHLASGSGRGGGGGTHTRLPNLELERGLESLDGFDVWRAITTGATSPRTELLHNIDIFGGVGASGFGNAALRVGDLKLIVGEAGGGNYSDNHYAPPGCNDSVCPKPTPAPGCAKDSADTNIWLFNISADPYELCNLADAQSSDVSRLMSRLKQFNDTQVPILYPANDPAANPKNRSGIEKGCWGPWLPNETASDPGSDLRASVTASSSAPAFLVSASASGCATDADCQLNGVCTAGACVCDAEWRGEQCHELRLLPRAAATPLPAYPPPAWQANTTSWGGSVLQDAGTGLYHMFVAEMLNSCGMTTWTTNSAIRHAVADSPLGPYEAKELVMSPFAHNPTAVRAPDGTYLIYHIGCGTPIQGHPPCTDCHGGLTGKCVGPGEMVACTTNTTNILHSKSLDGPWQQLNAAFVRSSTMGTPYQIDNPTVTFFPNGSLLMLGRGGNPSKEASSDGVITAASWRGPYVMHTEVGGSPSQPDVEDPFVWQDHRGNFHALFHKFTDEHPSCGGHAFSRDGFNWTVPNTAAYTTSIALTPSGSANFNRRERPHLFFDESGTRPTFLLTTLTNWSSSGANQGHDKAFTFAQKIGGQ